MLHLLGRSGSHLDGLNLDGPNEVEQETGPSPCAVFAELGG